MELGFFLIALICFFLVASYAFILYFERRLKLSWLNLRNAYKERFSAYANVLNIALLTYSAQSEVIIVMAESLGKSLKAELPEEYAASDKRLAAAYAKLCKLTEQYPLLYETEKYTALKDSLIVLDEKIAFLKQYYNKEAADYNRRVFSMPLRIVSSILNFRKKYPL